MKTSQHINTKLRLQEAKNHLKKARTRLPDDLNDDPNFCFRAYLDNNALEPAWDELAMLGRLATDPIAFWYELAQAARKMADE